MFLKKLFSLFVTISVFHSTQGQFNETFDDRDLVNSPEWYGDTDYFVINDSLELQLLAPKESGEKYIYTASEAIENAEWVIDVKMDFNPSSSNLMEIYIVADSSDMEHANGYFVRIGHTNDEISLFRKDGSKNLKIIDGLDDRVNLSYIELKIKVTRDQTGNWQLFSDVGQTGDFILEGEAFDNAYLSSKYFGLFCKYSKTRSDKLFFDNISVSGQSKSDTIPPEVLKLDVLDKNYLIVYFSEPVNLSNQFPEQHFLDNCQFIQPTEVTALNDSSFQVFFEESLSENLTCELIISNISDRANNELKEASASYMYIPPKQPGLNELLITEIMADPTPNRELPEYEYLEIFNKTEDTFKVSELVLSIRGSNNTIPDFDIAPRKYIIFCPNAAVDEFTGLGRTIGLTNWKSLLNAGDTINLSNKQGDLVFNLIYSEKWYQDPEKADGGYSLEMIDINNPCGEGENWKASQSESGGTPGKMNSFDVTNPDLKPPTTMGVFPTNENEILIDYDERVLSNSLDLTNFSTSPALSLTEISSDNPLTFYSILKTESTLQHRQIYNLTIRNISDCVGNMSKSQNLTFVLPETADSLDILFNEIMFNPVPGGVDFIEIVNVSEKYVDLKNWQLIREIDENNYETKAITNSHFIIEPGQLVVLTEDKNVLIGQYPNSSNAVFIETDMIPLNDDEGNVTLTDREGRIIDQLYYHEDFHFVFLKNQDGVSLERISPFGSSMQQEIWQSAAATMGYATPGLPNSHYLLTEVANSFSIEPKVFDPNNDGYRDFAQINFSFANPGYVASLYVFDITGNIVKTLLNNQTIPNEHFIVWHGDNEHGQKVPMGNYVVLLELFDPNGEKKVIKETVAVAKRF